jgi:crotonobetainyl-CoA:carnitine CoA-transferase CaiB-like acyl-CoA transferase
VRHPAPDLGADTEEVLGELGLGDEIARLRERRII